MLGPSPNSPGRPCSLRKWSSPSPARDNDDGKEPEMRLAAFLLFWLALLLNAAIGAGDPARDFGGIQDPEERFAAVMLASDDAIVIGFRHVERLHYGFGKGRKIDPLQAATLLRHCSHVVDL